MGVIVDDLDLSIHQFSAAWRVMCNPAPGRIIEAHDGIEYVFSGIPIPFFNIALLTGRGMSRPQLEARAREACAFAGRMDVPWLFIVTHEAIEGEGETDGLCHAYGLDPVMPLTGMVAEQVAPATTRPPGLEVVVPRDEAECGTILDINSAAYAMDLAAGKPLLGVPSFWTPHFPVLGVVDGAAVATAAVLMVDGIRYVALVATRPGHQRRGYADIVMRRALQLAAGTHPGSSTVLHATEAGRPIYERMGYRTISRSTLYMEQRFLTGH
jgi:GNAT superfamily N-acetyltransferase